MRASAIALTLLMATLLFFTLANTFASAQQASLQVLSYSSYIDSVDYYHVLGEVQNTGSVPLTQVTVSATLCDPSGHPTGTIEDYIMINLLAPQQKSPFDLFENATGTVCGVSPANSTLSNVAPYHNFQLPNPSSSRDAQGLYHLSGQVKNTGTSTAQGVDVVATFYDEKGVVVQVGSSLAAPSNLPPNGVGLFGITSDDPTLSARIATYSVQAQSATPTLPVPEYPASVPIVAISLILVLALIRRRPSLSTSRTISQ
jgi:hypothetical protein